MDHAYQSRRNEISEISDGLSLISTVLAVDAASNENLERIVKREDTLIDDESLRDCVVTNSARLGRLIHTIETTATHHDACTSGELACVDLAWRDRLTGCATPLNEKMTSLLERVASSLRTARDVLMTREGCDDGSSSPSDYSDSDSRSSDMDEDHGTDESESEDSESEEDD